MCGRIAGYRTARVMRVMNSLLKRVKAGRRLAGDPRAMKKLIKIRKWLDHINHTCPHRDQSVNL